MDGRSRYEVSSETARTKVKNDLIAATHEPAWSVKASEQRETTNRVLENGFRTLLMLNGNKRQQAQAERDISSGNFNLAGDGMGDG